MLTDLLTGYSICTKPEAFESFSKIIDAIDDVSAVDILIKYCDDNINHLHVGHLFQQYTFEIFNAIVSLTVDDDLTCSLSGSLKAIIDIFISLTPPRELYLVAAESLLSGARISSLPFILYSVQASLIKMDSIDVFNSGVTMVINRSSQICTEATIALEEEEGIADEDSDKEDDNMLIHDDAAPSATQLKITSTVECVVKNLTVFARGLMLNKLHWCTEVAHSTVVLEAMSICTPEKRGVLIGFLLAVLSRLVLLIDTNDDLRRQHTATLTYLLLLAADHQPLTLLNHLRREKHHLYRTKRRQIVQQMLSGKTPPATLVAESEYELSIASFVSQHLQSLEAVSWEHVIPNENVTDDYRAIWSSGSSGRTADKYQTINYSVGSPSAVGPCVSSSLQWSISGLAMVAGYLLNHCICSSPSSPQATGDSMFPLVYSWAYIKSSFEVYGNVLTRHSNLAVCEGLLYAKALGLLADSIAASEATPPLKLFLSVDTATTKGDHLLNRLVQHSYSHSTANGYSCEVTTALLIADSTDTLTVCNNIIIAMASCHDSQRCSEAMTGLRSILRQFEPRSLMCLLLRLIDQCPFVFISGLLIDMLKECAQAASLRLKWGQMSSPHSVTCAATSATTTTSGTVWANQNILSKVFRGVNEVLSTCKTGDDNDSPVWNRFKESGVIELPLRNYSVSAPVAATDASGQETDGVPSINTELCSSIYSCIRGSPFWSPLLSRSILPHLQHILKWTTVEKCLENLDVTAAVVNLIQFLAMRLHCGVAASEVTEEGPSISADESNSIVRYWRQSCESGSDDGESFLVASVQDLVQLWRGMKLVQDLIVGHILVSMEEKVKGRSNLQLTKVQLLCSNIDHSVNVLRSVCFSLCWVVK